MKPNELRIGNLIDRQDYICRVIQIDEKGIMTDPIEYKGERFVKQEIKPIPLTEEWLIKFGVKEIYKKQNILIELGGVWLDSGNECCWRVEAEIKYVHQLQNLYFALTGTELELK